MSFDIFSMHSIDLVDLENMVKVRKLRGGESAKIAGQATTVCKAGGRRNGGDLQAERGAEAQQEQPPQQHASGMEALDDAGEPPASELAVVGIQAERQEPSDGDGC